MKSRLRKILAVSGLTLAGYFATYFFSVRTSQFESHDQVVPIPVYRPFDGEFVQVAFGPAHLIDATYVRPAHWEPRTADKRNVH